MGNVAEESVRNEEKAFPSIGYSLSISVEEPNLLNIVLDDMRLPNKVPAIRTLFPNRKHTINIYECVFTITVKARRKIRTRLQ